MLNQASDRSFIVILNAEGFIIRIMGADDHVGKVSLFKFRDDMALHHPRIG